MDSTTHTTTTVEFVDWRAKAKEKLEAEDKMFKGGRAAASVQSYEWYGREMYSVHQ